MCCSGNRVGPKLPPRSPSLFLHLSLFLSLFLSLSLSLSLSYSGINLGAQTGISLGVAPEDLRTDSQFSDGSWGGGGGAGAGVGQRNVMQISLSHDGRVLDGTVAAKLCSTLKRLLETPSLIFM